MTNGNLCTPAEILTTIPCSQKPVCINFFYHLSTPFFSFTGHLHLFRLWEMGPTQEGGIHVWIPLPRRSGVELNRISLFITPTSLILLPIPPPPDKISLNPTVPPSPSVLSNGRWRFGNRGWIQPFQEADTSFMFPRNGQLLLSVKSDF